MYSGTERRQSPTEGIKELRELTPKLINREEQLRRDLQRYLTIFEVFPLAIVTLDSEMRVDFVNDKWTRWTGQDYSQAMNYGWLNVVYKEDKERLIEVLNARKEKSFSDNQEDDYICLVRLVNLNNLIMDNYVLYVGVGINGNIVCTFVHGKKTTDFILNLR